MGTYLNLTVLRPVGAAFRDDRSFVDEELKALSPAYGYTGPEDKYHAKIRVRSNYASMADIGAYLSSLRPDLNLRCWSMRHTHRGGAVISVGEEQIPLSEDVMESLKQDHEQDTIYENPDREWQLEVPWEEKDWLQELLPCYIDQSVIKRLLVARMSGIGQEMDPDWLAAKVDDYTEYGNQKTDFFGFLITANAYAKRKQMALYASLGD